MEKRKTQFLYTAPLVKMCLFILAVSNNALHESLGCVLWIQTQVDYGICKLPSSGNADFASPFFFPPIFDFAAQFGADKKSYRHRREAPDFMRWRGPGLVSAGMVSCV